MNLWLVYPLRKRVSLFLEVVKEDMIALLDDFILFCVFVCGHWCRPPSMLFNLVPIDPVDGIFLEHFVQQIIEEVGEVIDRRHLFRNDLRNQLLQRIREEGRLPRRHFVHDAAEGPEVGEVTVNPLVLE